MKGDRHWRETSIDPTSFGYIEQHRAHAWELAERLDFIRADHLQALSPTELQLIELRFWDQLPWQEVADRLEKSLSATLRMFSSTASKLTASFEQDERLTEWTESWLEDLW